MSVSLEILSTLRHFVFHFGIFKQRSLLVCCEKFTVIAFFVHRIEPVSVLINKDEQFGNFHKTRENRNSH